MRKSHKGDRDDLVPTPDFTFRNFSVEEVTILLNLP